MKRFVIASLCAGTVLFAAPPPMPTFSDFDLNNDGKIVQNEFEQAQAQRMQKMAEEGRPMRHAGEAPMFGEIDSDGNGFVTKEEFQVHQQHEMEKRKNRPMNNGQGMGPGMGQGMGPGRF